MSSGLKTRRKNSGYMKGEMKIMQLCRLNGVTDEWKVKEQVLRGELTLRDFEKVTQKHTTVCLEAF